MISRVLFKFRKKGISIARRGKKSELFFYASFINSFFWEGGKTYRARVDEPVGDDSCELGAKIVHADAFPGARSGVLTLNPCHVAVTGGVGVREDESTVSRGREHLCSGLQRIEFQRERDNRCRKRNKDVRGGRMRPEAERDERESKMGGRVRCVRIREALLHA